MMVWIVILVFIVAAIANSIIYFYRSNSASLNEASAVASAQRGMDTMVSTIREAGYSSSGAYPVVSIAPNDLKFYAAVPGSSFVEEVHYFLATTSTSSAALYQGIVTPTGDPSVYTGTEASSTLSRYVQNLALGTSTFTYFDQNGSLVTDYTKIQNVRYVTANIILNVDPNRPNPLTLRSSAALRNLVGH